MMENMLLSNDTICALATPAGHAIGIVRVSGPQAIACTDAIFRARNGKSLAEAHTRTLHYGEIVETDGRVVDDVLVSVFRAPHSYTGEDSTEISCHGSEYILTEVLNLLIKQGCRQAYPGEYTQRAFLNGKMDLSQAEAVADLIASTNRATHDVAMGQMRGHFSNELDNLRQQLLHITSLLELELDFSDQDVNFADREELMTLVHHADSVIVNLARSFETGKALKEGVPVVIVGKTNVGKSTLLNRLLHEERAIVSNIHGTTRDVIEDTTRINNVTFRFIDTAGIRQTTDVVEKLGIERTYHKIADAVIVLWMIDTLPTPSEVEEMKKQTKGKKLLVVANKQDVHGALQPQGLEECTINVGARDGINIAELENRIYSAADIPEITENSVIVTNARHYNALCKAHESIIRVEEGLKNNLSGDLLSEDLRECIDEIGSITGRQISSTEVLHSIFSHFCIGK